MVGGMADLRDTFLTEIKVFLAEADMPASTFGRQAMNDPGFVHRLYNGSQAMTATVDRVRGFMAERRAARAA